MFARSDPFNPSRPDQITQLQLLLSEKDKELKLVAADADQRSAERERVFESQVFPQCVIFPFHASFWYFSSDTHSSFLAALLRQ
jgi:hypothetical protein